MSPVGAVFVPFPPKTGTSFLHPRSPQSLNGSPVLVATRYGGGRNSNRATLLADMFEAGTLQRLSELELGPPCYTEDIAHQAENTSFNVEYAYVAANALRSFSRGKNKEQILNTFKEAMTLPQAVRSKVASDEEISSLEKHSVSRVLGMNVTRDRKEGIITINQKDYTEDIVRRYGVRGCNLAYTPGVGPELSRGQPQENFLNEEGKRRYHSITGTAMYLAQVCRYDILYTVNQLARQCPSYLRHA